MKVRTFLLLLCAAGVWIGVAPAVLGQATRPSGRAEAMSRDAEKTLTLPSPGVPGEGMKGAAPGVPGEGTDRAARQSAAASGEETPEQIAAQYLGERFTSRASGISFRPPLRGTQIKSHLAGSVIVQYVNAEEKWSLRVTHMVLEKPQPLVEDKSIPATAPPAVRKPVPGVLDQIVEQIIAQNAGTRILRKDTISVGPHDAGLLIARFSQPTQMFLRQMVIIQRDKQDYYVLDLTTPSTRSAADPDEVEDPGEVMAVKIFRSILDSVQLLDMRPIMADRDERLYNALSTIVNMPNRLKQAAQAEQYFRIQRNGQDIGWSFQTEEFGERQGEAGFFSAVVSEVTPEAGVKINTSSEMFCADRQRGEAWVTITTIEKDGKKAQTTEYGQAQRRILRKMVKGTKEEADAKDPANKDPRNPVMLQSRQDRLLVTQTSEAGVVPIQRDLPPVSTCVQQALANMLPRLVPVIEPQKYLYSVWVGSERELVFRYIDVEARRTVNFAGRNVMVIPIKDRIGLDGEPTYHYLTPEGKYLGSAASGGVNVIACDGKTLAGLYPNANFVRPHVLDTPGEK